MGETGCWLEADTLDSYGKIDKVELGQGWSEGHERSR